MRLFLDTNIIISAILFPDSLVGGFLRYAVERHIIVLSSYVIDELYKVFELKFKKHLSDLEAFLTDFSYDLVHTPRNLNPNKYPKLRDPDDVPIIASAMLGDCDYLISGDKDILAVELERPRIVTAASFMTEDREEGLDE